MKTTYFLIAALFMASIVAGCKTSTSPITPSGSAPTISSFTALPASIQIGDSAVLSWSVGNSPTTITIDNGIGDVTVKSSVTVSPAQTTTYTLTAKNSSGQNTATTTVTVANPGDPGAPPNPAGLTAIPGNAGIINLNWSVSTGAANYLIERRSVNGFAQISSAAVNSYSDAGLFPGVSYTYRVRSVSSGGAKSGYSNFATAIAPGSAPIVDHVSIVPTTPPALLPNQTVQFTATAYDGSGNDLHFAQNIFAWNSTAPQIASINGLGLATAGSQQGIAIITASIGGVTSNQVNLNVSLQKNHILVVFHPASYDPDGFAMYNAALTNVGVDYLTDNSVYDAPQITFSQIKDYDRVFFCSHVDNNLNPGMIALFEEYVAQSGKRLIIMGNSDLIGGDNAFLNLLGLTQEGWMDASNTGLTYTGGANTSMAGFSFTRIADYQFTSILTFDQTGTALAAITTKDVTSENALIIASSESNVGNNSKVFYNGFVLENVQSDQRATFMAHLINNF